MQNKENTFENLIQDLIAISERLNLEPVQYPPNPGLINMQVIWGDYEIFWFPYEINKKTTKNMFHFTHPMDNVDTTNPNNQKNNISEKHSFSKYTQCLQSLVQHRIFHLVIEETLL